jgi:thiol-disulfide isomerase/thioredoxin
MVPEIDMIRVMEELGQQVRKGECILFLGAGVHSVPPAGSEYAYPEDERPLLAQDLARRLAEICRCEQTCPDRLCSGLQRISLCIETSPVLGRKRLVDFLTQHLHTCKKASPALEMLAQMPFRIVVTTNYDSLFESALRRQGKEPIVLVYDPNPNAPTPDVEEDPTKERPLLFKMHGELKERDSIVITDEDYITFVQRMSDKEELHPFPQTVRYRMKQWPTLFVGYSLQDFNLRLIFRTLRWRVDPANFPTSFAVDVHPDPLLLRVYQHERHFITFVAQDLWEFVPRLFQEVTQGGPHG